MGTTNNLPHDEAQQIEFISLMTDYKTAVAQCKTNTKFDLNYFIALLSFLASIIALVFGCACGKPCDIFNYIMMALAGFLFLIILFMQILPYRPLYWVRRVFCRKNKSDKKSLTSSANTNLNRNDRKQKSENNSLMFLLTDKFEDDDFHYSRTNIIDIITLHSEIDKAELNNLSDEELVEKLTTTCGMEASIPAYRDILKQLNALIDENNRRQKIRRRFLIGLSVVILVTSIVYLFLKFI